MERVQSLAANKIALGMMIPTIESRASHIPVTKGTTYVVMRSDDKDLHRICGSQYGHPGPAIGY